MSNQNIVFSVHNLQISVNYGAILQLIGKAHVAISTSLIVKFYRLMSVYFGNTRLLVVALIVITIILALERYMKHNSAQDLSSSTSTKAALALHALSKIVIPSSSIWPEHYVAITRLSAHRRNSTVSIPLATLINDIKNGALQIRVSSTDFRHLIEGKMCINGWSFELGVTLFNRIDILRWVILDELSGYSSEVSETLNLILKYLEILCRCLENPHPLTKVNRHDLFISKNKNSNTKKIISLILNTSLSRSTTHEFFSHLTNKPCLISRTF